MTRSAKGAGAGSVVVAAGGAPRCTEVVGTVEMAGGGLVVRVEPARVREATARRLPRESDPVPTTLAGVAGMRYVGPLTPAQALRCRAEIARWQARPRWRRWVSAVASCCWGW